MFASSVLYIMSVLTKSSDTRSVASGKFAVATSIRWQNCLQKRVSRPQYDIEFVLAQRITKLGESETLWCFIKSPFSLWREDGLGVLESCLFVRYLIMVCCCRIP